MSDFRIKPRILVAQRDNCWVAKCIDFVVPEVTADEKGDVINVCIQDLFIKATIADLRFGCESGSDLIDWCAGTKLSCDLRFTVYCDCDDFIFEGFDVRVSNES